MSSGGGDFSLFQEFMRWKQKGGASQDVLTASDAAASKPGAGESASTPDAGESASKSDVGESASKLDVGESSSSSHDQEYTAADYLACSKGKRGRRTAATMKFHVSMTAILSLMMIQILMYVAYP